MGFLSSLLGIAAPIAGALVGLPPAPAAAPVAAPLPVATNNPLITAFNAAGTKPSIIDAAVPTARTSIVSGPLTSADLVRAQGGMKNRVRTVVQTIAPNGTIVNQEFLEGRPFLMNKEIVMLKRTLKLIGKADKRIPRARSRGGKQKQEIAKLKGFIDGATHARAMLPITQVIDT